MKFFLLLLLLAAVFNSPAQTNTTAFSQNSERHSSEFTRIHSAEICSNNIDDNNNGLVDNDDFVCYYSGNNTDSCPQSKIIWACSNYGIHWTNMQTGVERFVGFTNHTFYDIAWASNGKLYGVENIAGDIYEIDPYTGASVFVGSLPPPYYSSNAMTGDGSGNLYLTAYTTSRQWHLIKINIATWQTTLITNFSTSNFDSGGDLAFLNGALYLAGGNSNIAKINIKTGIFQIFPLVGSPMPVIAGLTTLGDGYLYMSAIDRLYKIDPSTMKLTSSVYHYSYGNIYVLGLSNYTEVCNAGGCRASVQISVVTPHPYCSNRGVLLKARGSGSSGANFYTWHKPDNSITVGDTLTAFASGVYKVRFHTQPDTCGANDSIHLVITMPPDAALGHDTMVCPNTSILLSPLNNTNNNFFNWNTGSTQSAITVTNPGAYWVQTSNVCGTSYDTVVVYAGSAPQVLLSEHKIYICPGSFTFLKNNAAKNTWDKYLWSINSTEDSILISAGGIYWLKSFSSCGNKTDTAFVYFKDSCSCFPFYAKVDLGGNREFCEYDSIMLRNLVHQTGFHYVWSDGSGDSVLKIKKPGWYRLDASTYCGAKSDSVYIELKKEGCERILYVPNSFTPNSDGKNDKFHPIAQGVLASYELSIFNRWGNLVFYSRNINDTWDGTVNGVVQNTSVFVWRCRYQFLGLPQSEKTGIVVLIK